MDVFAGAVRDRLRGRTIQTLINLGRDLQNLDMKIDSVQQKVLLRQSLIEQLCLTEQVKKNKHKTCLKKKKATFEARYMSLYLSEMIRL